MGNIKHIFMKSERQEACHINGCFSILFRGYNDLSFITLKTGSEVERESQKNFG